MSARAERLAADLKVETLTGIPRALAEEAVKTLERMDELDRILQGHPDAWLGVLQRLSPDVAEVVINAPLAEARQQALALKALLAEFAKLAGVEAPEVPASAADEIRAARERRIAAARGLAEQA